jgi:hypothetical protein
MQACQTSMTVNACIYLASVVLGAATAIAGELLVPAQFATIQSAIDAAQRGDVVVIAAGVYTEKLIIAKSVELSGEPGVILDGGKVVQSILTISAGPVTLEGLTFRNAYHKSAVWITDASVTIRDCTFTDNDGDAGGVGGAIRLQAFAPHVSSVEDCEFTGNHAGTGGAIWQQGTGQLNVTGTQFAGNWAKLDGGAAWVRNAKLQSCDFVNNHASILSSSGKGGAIRVLIASSILEIHDCHFQGNSRTAVYMAGSQATVTESTFLNNDAGGSANDLTLGGGFCCVAGLAMSDCNFSGNHAWHGGAFYVAGETKQVTVVNCDFSENTAFSGGGVGFLSGAATSHFTGCTFTGNVAEYNVGGFGAVASVVVEDCLIADNVAPDGAGAWVKGNTPLLKLKNTVICDNVVDDIDGKWTDLGGNSVCNPNHDADLNQDGSVDGADLGILLSNWGEYYLPGDLNNDYDVVNGTDLGILLAAWTG